MNLKNRLKRDLNLILIGLFLLTLMIGYVIAFDNTEDTESLIEELTQSFNLINQYRSEDQDVKSIIFSGIDGMLSTLDPHTHFLRPETFKYMREEQEGSFYGIGISFDVRNGELIVVSPIEGTPAYKAGIRAGDRIIEIEGESTTGITTSEVIKKLRGRKGTKVTITVYRPTTKEKRTITLVRDLIPLKSVPYYYLLDDNIGYVRIINFSSTTEKELKNALKELKTKGMKKLIIDLRSNSGGLLSAAIKVCSLFLKKGQLIVYTRGRNEDSDMEFVCQKDGEYSRIPLVILVDEWSASASEIVAGAIMDHDRGVIIGKNTFGKGLVGSLYPLRENCALQITTAQYFTPSGRCIQKPYITPHKLRREKISKSQRKEYFTDSGREVYSNGGIVPDVIIPDEKISMLELKINGTEFDFAVYYNKEHPDISKDIKIDDKILEQYYNFLLEKKYDIKREDFFKIADKLKQRLHSEIIAVKFGPQEGYKVKLLYDKYIIKAKEVLKDVNKYLQVKK